MHEPKQVRREATHTNTNKNVPFFQPKLTINKPGDAYEQEADFVADSVMRMTNVNANEGFSADALSKGDSLFKPSPLSIPRLQRTWSIIESKNLQKKCDDCEEEEKLHRKESSSQPAEASNNLSSYVSSLSSHGASLPSSSRIFFEPRFGYDFSKVKVHNDSSAHESARNVNALAYTHGNNIVFGAGQFSPESDYGRKLLAHELAHVLQQAGLSHNLNRINNSSILQRTLDPCLQAACEKIGEIPIPYPMITKAEMIHDILIGIDLHDNDNLQPVLAKIDQVFHGDEHDAIRSYLLKFIKNISVTETKASSGDEAGIPVSYPRENKLLASPIIRTEKHSASGNEQLIFRKADIPANLSKLKKLHEAKKYLANRKLQQHDLDEQLKKKEDQLPRKVRKDIIQKEVDRKKLESELTKIKNKISSISSNYIRRRKKLSKKEKNRVINLSKIFTKLRINLLESRTKLKLEKLIGKQSVSVDQYNKITNDIIEHKQTLLKDYELNILQNQFSIKNAGTVLEKENESTSVMTNKILQELHINSIGSAEDVKALGEEKNKRESERVEKMKGKKRDQTLSKYKEFLENAPELSEIDKRMRVEEFREKLDLIEFDGQEIAREIITALLTPDEVSGELTIEDKKLILRYFISGNLSSEDKQHLKTFIKNYLGTDENRLAAIGFDADQADPEKLKEILTLEPTIIKLESADQKKKFAGQFMEDSKRNFRLMHLINKQTDGKTSKQENKVIKRLQKKGYTGYYTDSPGIDEFIQQPYYDKSELIPLLDELIKKHKIEQGLSESNLEKKKDKGSSLDIPNKLTTDPDQVKSHVELVTGNIKNENDNIKLMHGVFDPYVKQYHSNSIKNLKENSVDVNRILGTKEYLQLASPTIYQKNKTALLLTGVSAASPLVYFLSRAVIHNFQSGNYFGDASSILNMVKPSGNLKLGALGYPYESGNYKHNPLNLSFNYKTGGTEGILDKTIMSNLSNTSAQEWNLQKDRDKYSSATRIDLDITGNKKIDYRDQNLLDFTVSPYASAMFYAANPKNKANFLQEMQVQKSSVDLKALYEFLRRNTTLLDAMSEPTSNNLVDFNAGIKAGVKLNELSINFNANQSNVNNLDPLHGNYQNTSINSSVNYDMENLFGPYTKVSVLGAVNYTRNKEGWNQKSNSVEYSAGFNLSSSKNLIKDYKKSTMIGGLNYQSKDNMLSMKLNYDRQLQLKGSSLKFFLLGFNMGINLNTKQMKGEIIAALNF